MSSTTSAESAVTFGEFRVVPFGISSGRPTSTRHVSGLGFDLGPQWLLVDCGEGTQQQVMRSPLKLSKLDNIFITHLHGDHVLGLPGLLASLAMDGRTRPVKIVAPLGINTWLDVMLSLPILQLGYPLEVTELDPADFTSRYEPMPLGTFAGLRVSTLPLMHRVPSFGYRFEEPERPGQVDVERARSLGIEPGPDLGRLQRGATVNGVSPAQVMGPPRPGRVVTILGDTEYAPTSIRLAQDADLLVHECTYAAKDHALCSKWTHSCTDDVARVANRAEVRQLVINHFSSRYFKPQDLAREVRERLKDPECQVVAAVEGRPVTVDS